MPDHLGTMVAFMAQSLLFIDATPASSAIARQFMRLLFAVLCVDSGSTFPHSHTLPVFVRLRLHSHRNCQ